jgi:hypothetical protein
MSKDKSPKSSKSPQPISEAMAKSIRDAMNKDKSPVSQTKSQKSKDGMAASEFGDKTVVIVEE